MKLINNSKIICGIFLSVFVLTSCSTVVFPDIDEDQNELTSDSADRKYIEESSALASDTKHASYEDDNVSVTEASYTPETEAQIASAKVVPVYKESPEGYTPTKVVTNDPGLNKLLEEGDAAAERAPSDNEYQTPASSFENVQPTPQTFSVSYRIATFLFDNGSAELNPEYNSKIREIVKLAKDNDAVVNVYGYASSRTRNTDIASHKMANFEVSSKRADSVLRALKRAGLNAAQIRVEALSDTNPAYLEVMPEGERLNRRAEVYISY